MTQLFALALLVTLVAGCAHQPQSDEAKRGRDHLQFYGCGSCHTIPGVPGARATVGPPLDRLGSRSYLAGTLSNNRPNLQLWIQHPQQLHPGSAMPELGVTPADAKDIAQYLEELR